MRSSVVVFLLLVLAGAAAPVGASEEASTGWIAVTFQPPARGEANLVLDLPPASDVVIGYMVVREGRAPGGFAHSFRLDGEGSEERWDMSSGVSPLLNSWSVDGDVASGLRMSFGITAKHSAQPTQIMAWVAGSPFTWTFGGADVLSTREGADVVLAREDQFELGRYSLDVEHAFTGAFSTMPSACAMELPLPEACLPPRACVFPVTCVDLVDQTQGTWVGPNGTSGRSMAWTMFGGRGPDGWFTLAPAGEYTFEVQDRVVSRPPVVVSGVDAAWRDPTIP